VDVSSEKEPGSQIVFPHVTIVIDKSDEFAYFCAISRWSQVVEGFYLFVEGFNPILRCNA
jgi:hypothetical protein